jgi:uncharacterized membrane protein YgcG
VDETTGGYAGRAGVLYQVYRKRGKTPEEAAHLIERHRNVLESEWTNQVQRYLAYAATLEGGAIGPDGRVKPWDQLTEREHILKGFLASLGLSPAEVERRAAQASYLVGPNGPKDLVTWLKYLHSHGPSMFDAEGFLKQPGTFTQDVNNVVSGVVYDDGVSGKAAAARVDEKRRAAEAEAPKEQEADGLARENISRLSREQEETALEASLRMIRETLNRELVAEEADALVNFLRGWLKGMSPIGTAFGADPHPTTPGEQCGAEVGEVIGTVHSLLLSYGFEEAIAKRLAPYIAPHLARLASRYPWVAKALEAARKVMKARKGLEKYPLLDFAVSAAESKAGGYVLEKAFSSLMNALDEGTRSEVPARGKGYGRRGRGGRGRRGPFRVGGGGGGGGGASGTW